jgi:tetratricopeptide (TPR) repeat protein
MEEVHSGRFHEASRMGADKARKAKPRVIPPLPVWPRRESAVLSEVPETALAIELWLYLRHLRDWVDSGQNATTELFHPASTDRVRSRRAEALDDAGPLESAIAVFHELSDAPAGVTAERLRDACITVADWANEHGYGVTAAQFGATATRIAPESPLAANVAGLTHRRLGEWTNAELYYGRAARYARRHKNADEYVAAHIGMAALALARGRHKGARRHLNTASNEARRSGSTWLASHAQHDLMLMLTERREYRQAEVAAARAVTLYPVTDPRFPYLAADFAFLLLAQRMYAEALPILQRFLSLIEAPAQQVIAMSLLSRAYAGVGRRDDSRNVRRAVNELIKTYPQDAPAALYHMAEACRAEGAWEEAEQLIEASRARARAAGDVALVGYADQLAEEIADRNVPPAPAAEDDAGLRRSITTALSARLAHWRPNSRRGRKRHPRRNHWAA